MVGTVHALESGLFTPLGAPPAAYICRRCVQVAASTSLASMCFLWERYFCFNLNSKSIVSIKQRKYICMVGQEHDVIIYSTGSEKKSWIDAI